MATTFAGQTAHRIAEREESAFVRAYLIGLERFRRRLRIRDLTRELRFGLNYVESILPFDDMEEELRQGFADRYLDINRKAAFAAVPAFKEQASFDISIVKQEPKITFVFDLADPRAAAQAERYAAELVTLIGPETKLAIRELIVAGQTQGLSPEQIARQVRDLVGLNRIQQRALDTYRAGLIEAGRSESDIQRLVAKEYERKLRRRAETIARNETLKAAHAGQQELWQQAIEQGYLESDQTQRVWITAVDDRVCPICEPMGGQKRGMHEQFISPAGPSALHPPIHVACLPGDAIVTPRGRITSASKRWFNGNMVILDCATDFPFTSTPNHPILTPHGWIAANMLNIGDEVIYPIDSEWVTRTNRQNVDKPARIHDIAKAFFNRSSVFTIPVPMSTEDFHGDGLGSQVAVVAADRYLRNGFDPPLQQHVSDGILMDRNVDRVEPILSSLSCIDSGLFGQNDLSHPFMSCGDLSLALCGRHSRPFHLFGFGSATDHNTLIEESQSDSPTVTSKALGQDILRDPGTIELGDFVVRKVKARYHKPFSGYVYNLETTESYYIANGVASHNCRCDVALEIA